MTLSALLTTLGIAPAPRYTIEEVARILGNTPRQVRTQIQKGRIPAIKSSVRRWGWVLHPDLEAYFAAINAKGGE
jgi:pantothenate kinase type III